MSDILFTFDFLYFWEEVYPHDWGARSSSFKSHSRNYSCPLSPVTLLTEIEVNTHKGRQWRHRVGQSGDVQGKDVTSAFTPLACLHCCVSDSYTPSNHWSGLREHSHLPISPRGGFIFINVTVVLWLLICLYQFEGISGKGKGNVDTDLCWLNGYD